MILLTTASWKPVRCSTIPSTWQIFLCAADLEERVKAVDELMEDGLIRKLRERLEEVKNDGRAA